MSYAYSTRCICGHVNGQHNEACTGKRLIPVGVFNEWEQCKCPSFVSRDRHEGRKRKNPKFNVPLAVRYEKSQLTQ